MIRLIADDLWDSLCLSNATHILHFWSLVFQESPARWPHFGHVEVAEIFLFEQLPGFFWLGPNLETYPFRCLSLQCCTIPKILVTYVHRSVENSPLAISQFGKQLSPSLRSNEKTIQIYSTIHPFSIFCFPGRQIRSTVQVQASNARLNVVLATGADLTRRGALIAVRTVGRDMDSIWILFKDIEMIWKFGKLKLLYRYT